MFLVIFPSRLHGALKLVEALVGIPRLGGAHLSVVPFPLGISLSYRGLQRRKTTCVRRLKRLQLCEGVSETASSLPSFLWGS